MLGLPGAPRTALYYRLIQILREQIEAGGLQPGDRLPSERELSARYGVSRMTARHALEILANEGLVERRQGSGSFVARPKIHQQGETLRSFTEDMRQLGLEPGAKVLSAGIREASAHVARALGLGADRRVVRLERLRTASGEPVALEVSHLPARFAGVLEEDLTGSLYAILARRFGQSLAYADQYLAASTAGEHEAQLLGVRPGSPVLRIERVTYGPDHVPVEFVSSMYRGDRYRFHVRLVRNGPVPGGGADTGSGG